jgi:hypothetical protein
MGLDRQLGAGRALPSLGRPETLRRCLIPVVLFTLMLGAVPLSAARAEEGGEKKPAGGPIFVHFTPLSFSVIGTNNRIYEQVSISLVIELAKNKGENALDPFTPRLQDAYLTALSQIWDEHPAGTPPATSKEIKDKLMTTTEAITGPGFVSAILIGGIDERIR